MRRLALMASLCLLASCAAEPAPPVQLSPTVFKSTQQYTREYVLQPGDQIEVSIYHVPDLSKTVTVRPDGYVSLPFVKDIKVTGISIPDLDKQLTKRYGERLVDPDVTVNVVNPRAASVFVLGEVQHPGPVPVRDAPTVAVAVAAAGGMARTAARDNVAVIHMDKDGILTGTILNRDVSGETAFYMTLSNMALENGDIVIVPESGRSQFVRFVADYINTPLTAINQGLTPYYQFRILSILTQEQNTNSAAAATSVSATH